MNGPVSFHRDNVWTEEKIDLFTLHSFVGVSDMTREYGATVVVPGSHRECEPGYHFSESSPGKTVPGSTDTVHDRRWFASSIHLEAPAGSLVLFNPMAIHSPGINVSKHKRSVFNVAFNHPDRKGLLNFYGIATRRACVPARPDILSCLVNVDFLSDTYLSCENSLFSQFALNEN